MLKEIYKKNLNPKNILVVKVSLRDKVPKIKLLEI